MGKRILITGGVVSIFNRSLVRSGGTVVIVDLFTHRYPLAQLGQALEDTIERPEGFMKPAIKVGN